MCRLFCAFAAAAVLCTVSPAAAKQYRWPAFLADWVNAYPCTGPVSPEIRTSMRRDRFAGGEKIFAHATVLKYGPTIPGHVYRPIKIFWDPRHHIILARTSGEEYVDEIVRSENRRPPETVRPADLSQVRTVNGIALGQSEDALRRRFHLKFSRLCGHDLVTINFSPRGSGYEDSETLVFTAGRLSAIHFES